MTKLAPGGRLPHGQLQVPVELIPQKDRPVLVPDVPRVVLECSQVEIVKRPSTGVAEEWKIQFGRAVGVAKEQPEGVLGIVRTPTETATDSDAAVDLKTLCAVRLDEFDGAGAFGLAAVPLCVGIDAGLPVEQVIQIHHDGERWQRVEPRDEFLGVAGVIDDPGIHPVIDLVFPPAIRERLRRQSIWGLSNDVVHEKEGACRRGRGLETWLEGGRTQRCR